MEHGTYPRTKLMSCPVLRKSHKIEGILRPIAIQHLPCHAGKHIRPEYGVAASVRRPQGKHVVLLCLPLLPQVPSHRRGSSRKLRHHPIEAAFDIRPLLLFEIRRNFIQLSNHCFASQSSAVLVVP